MEYFVNRRLAGAFAPKPPIERWRPAEREKFLTELARLEAQQRSDSEAASKFASKFASQRGGRSVGEPRDDQRGDRFPGRAHRLSLAPVARRDLAGGGLVSPGEAAGDGLPSGGGQGLLPSAPA